MRSVTPFLRAIKASDPSGCPPGRRSNISASASRRRVVHHRSHLSTSVRIRLVHLALYLTTWVSERHLDLSPCTALRTLRLDCRDEREVSPEWNWVLSLLSHLPRTGSALRTITLAFQHSSHALATLLPFAGELDRVLAAASSPARLTRLDAVEFEFEFPTPAAAQRDEDEEALLEMFPLVREAGLLRGTCACLNGPNLDHAYSMNAVA